MKTLFLFLLFVTLRLTTFSQVNDSTEIITLLKNDFKTLETSDAKKHIENCTEDYMLIENGEVWDIKKEIEILFHPTISSKIVRQDEFSFKKIKIDNPYAYVVYELTSKVTEDGNTKTYHTIESVLFYKVSGKWKIKLLHSTKINIRATDRPR